MPLKVVKVNSARDNFTQYIGRKMGTGRGGLDLSESCFHNPFRIGPTGGTREDVLLKFAEYWYAPEQSTLRQHALDTLDQYDILGCWCKPLPCHGDFIVGYVKWKNQERQLCL